MDRIVPTLRIGRLTLSESLRVNVLDFELLAQGAAVALRVDDQPCVTPARQQSAEPLGEESAPQPGEECNPTWPTEEHAP
jgi:hypothetical protein